MFKGVKIGTKDINGKDICEGNKIRFKSVYCGDRWIEGVVKYSLDKCAFVLEMPGDDGSFSITAEVTDLEVIDTDIEPKEEIRMKHKIVIWVRKYSRDLEFYIEDNDDKEKYNIFAPPSIYIEDDCQVDELKKMFEYLGYDVIAKEIDEED